MAELVCDDGRVLNDVPRTGGRALRDVVLDEDGPTAHTDIVRLVRGARATLNRGPVRPDRRSSARGGDLEVFEDDHVHESVVVT